MHRCFLKKCKYIVKERKISRYTTDDLEISSDDSDEKAFDKSDKFDNSDKVTDVEKILMGNVIQFFICDMGYF